MKCYSVHMAYGVMEGIRLSGQTKTELLILGDARPITTMPWFRECLKAVHRFEPEQVVSVATVQWHQKDCVGTYETTHRLRCGWDQASEFALVMIGSYDHKFKALKTPRIAGKGKTYPRLVAKGSYKRRQWEAARRVRQRLYVMPPGSSLLLISRSVKRENDRLISWNGAKLRMFPV